MALTTAAATTAGNGLGSRTYVYAVTIATITVADAVVAIENTYGNTIAGIDSTTNATCYVLAQGAGGAEATGGIALLTTFED